MTKHNCLVIVSILYYSFLLLGLNLQSPGDFTLKHFPTKHLIHDAVRNSVWTSEFDIKHLKKAEGHIDRNIEYKNKDEVNSSIILSNNKLIIGDIFKRATDHSLEVTL